MNKKGEKKSEWKSIKQRIRKQQRKLMKSKAGSLRRSIKLINYYID